MQGNYYLCPNKRKMLYNRTTSGGYIEYERNNCEKCSYGKTKCIIRRHVHEDIRERARIRRISVKGIYLSKKRSRTIERSFADAKQNHGMRFAKFKGEVKNQD